MHGTYYCSSKYGMGCTARIKFSENEGVRVISGDHKHNPPKYVLTTDGTYVKI